MTPIDSTHFESFVPVYDVMPDKWDDARPAIVEQLKKITNSLNSKEIGWYLDEELLSGKAYIPGLNNDTSGGTSQQFRQILRKVIEFPILNAGINSQPHGITIDGNFTLIQLWGSATNATAFTGEPIPNAVDTIGYTASDIVITVAAGYTRGMAVIEYIQEL